jgi:hypothetical protein
MAKVMVVSVYGRREELDSDGEQQKEVKTKFSIVKGPEGQECNMQQLLENWLR